MKISELLLKLIEKKFYIEKAGVQNKLDVFYAMSKITDGEYTTLTLKVEEVYTVVEETEEVTEEVAEEQEKSMQEETAEEITDNTVNEEIEPAKEEK